MVVDMTLYWASRRVDTDGNHTRAIRPEERASAGVAVLASTRVAKAFNVSTPLARSYFQLPKRWQRVARDSPW